MHALVVLPTYNERKNLSRLLPAILEVDPDLDLLVIDDNSPDGTGEEADRLAAMNSRVKVVHRARKSGLGTAYVAGFSYALSRGYDHVVEMDADFSHRPEDLPTLLSAAANADVVIGSRNVPGGTVIGWSWIRRFVSRGGSWYARLVLQLPVRDCTSGFKCFSRFALAHLDIDHLVSNGYAFQVEVNHACNQAGLKLVEVPITFPDRDAGHSKMTPAIAFEAAWLVLRLRFGIVRAAVRSAPVTQEAS